MNKIFNSIRVKLFLKMCLLIIIVMGFLVVVNSVVLETFFYYKKTNTMIDTYNKISELKKDFKNKEIYSQLDNISLENDLDIVIKNNNNLEYCNSKDFVDGFSNLSPVTYEVNYSIFNKTDILYSNSDIAVRKARDQNTGLSFMYCDCVLDENYNLYIRIPISSINENVNISNIVLTSICCIAILISGFYILFITKWYTQPIISLQDITNKMNQLDFSEKYIKKGNDDEIDELGKNINDLSEKLENTIKQLKKNNMQLERDIEEKSKIDEMRKQFISDVSHELKTPIALIQGYAEGLVENVATDEESKIFYSKVILDESNKMDKLVKRLLELIKLEYEDIVFNDNNFDIVELINSVITNSKVIITEQNINVIFKEKEPIYVCADEFYIEQVITNYFTNALKNVLKINNEKKIEISIEKAEEQGKIRVKVFNTGKKIDEENIERIWTRFYKIDKSRNRLSGGTGIGLALVKAIMNKYKNKFGVENKENGVEFYFELNYSIISNEM